MDKQTFINKLETNYDAYDTNQPYGHLLLLPLYNSNLELQITMYEVIKIQVLKDTTDFHATIGEFKNLDVAYQIIQQIYDGSINVDKPFNLINL